MPFKHAHVNKSGLIVADEIINPGDMVLITWQSKEKKNA